VAAIIRTQIVVGLAIVVAAACDMNGTPCYPGDYRPCTCNDGGGSGLQLCAADGSAYGECVCGAVPQADAGGDLPFLTPCKVDSECQSGLCGIFPSKGNRCTLHCRSGGDCPAPSPKCNPMGVCAAP
jgi:hypothetical protein